MRPPARQATATATGGPGPGPGDRSGPAGLSARIEVARGGLDLSIDLHIAPGTTAALLGPNGAGKSTTVEVLAGLLPLDGGRITLDGVVLDDPGAGVFVPPERRRAGVVFQRYYLFDHLDVADNVAFGPRSAGSARRPAREAARRWLDALDLGSLAARRPGELSGGQAQQVALARALASDPAVLLLDEPLAALDVAVRAGLRRRLRDHLASYPGPRLLITHDPGDAFLLADTIHVLENGRITQHGSSGEIRRRPVTAYVAALAGVNLLTGIIRNGELTLDGHDLVLRCADTHTSGPVLATIRPNAVALHPAEPHGSPRNVWAATVAVVEPLGEVTRVVLGGPVPLSVDVTPAAIEAIHLAPGVTVWVSVKATEIGIAPA